MSPKTFRQTMRRLVPTTLIAALLISQLVPALKAIDTPAQDPKPRQLQKTRVSDAVALLAHLLDRYADHRGNQTALDKKLDRALSKIQDSRNIARRLVDNFRRIPLAQRQSVFGKYADLRSTDNVSESEIRAAFKRAIEGAPRPGSIDQLPRPGGPAPLPNPSRKHLQSEGKSEEKTSLIILDRDSPNSLAWQRLPANFSRPAPANGIQRGLELQYRGIYCQQETDEDRGTDSDEIYVVTSVIDFDTRETTTIDHPRGRPPYYQQVDDGDKREGPIRAVWTGTPATLAMFIAVMEQDEGDPSLFRNSLGVLVTAAYEGAVDLMVFLPGAFVLGLVGGLIEITSYFLDAVFTPGDETIDIDGIVISREQLTAFAATALVEDRRWPSYHFYTIHTNRDLGARYFVMFGLRGPPFTLPPAGGVVSPGSVGFPDLIISRFIEAGRPVLRGGDFYVPVKVDVKNSSDYAAGVFKVEVRMKDAAGRDQTVAFTVAGSSDARLAVSTGPLAGGASRTFEGEVKIPSSGRGRTVLLSAVADSCAEGGLPAHCRVQESDERNNISSSIRVTLPR